MEKHMLSQHKALLSVYRRKEKICDGKTSGKEGLERLAAYSSGSLEEVKRHNVKYSLRFKIIY
jgi:hypothetical protein